MRILSWILGSDFCILRNEVSDSYGPVAQLCVFEWKQGEKRKIR
jgi:hypothetical protein